MARYQLFESDCEVAFEFDKVLTTDKEEIKIFIDKYNQIVNNSGQWSGGPVNSEFVNFWNKYHNIRITTKAFKPTVLY